MLSSVYIVLALAASNALAAPTYDGWTSGFSQDQEAISSYFNACAKRNGAGNPASTCNLNAAVMPGAPSPLPAPSSGLTLKHVAIGRGTQNYTCSPNNPAAVPVANGAVATLYNASCIAAKSPSILATLPNFALQYNLGANPSAANVANLFLSGYHFFPNSTTPFFNLDTASMQLGEAPCAKNAATPAPSDAPKGQGGVGDGAVPWLKLLTRDGATGNLEEVYRLNTAGGNPPANCAGMAATFEVQYAAEYWFWQK